MKDAMNNIPLIAAIALALTSPIANSKEIACRNVERYQNEGAFIVEATLTLTHGEISQVSIDRITEVYATKTGYTCSATIKNGEANNKWEISGRRTFISIEPDESDEPSSLVITQTAKGYILDTKNLSKATCGARVQWPDQVFVPVAGGKCVIRDP
jgi:hypothetical protein